MGTTKQKYKPPTKGERHANLVGKKPTPTLKQMKFIKEYVKNGGNGAAAVRAAGYNAKRIVTQSTLAYDTLKKPYVRLEIEKLLNKNGVEVDGIVRIHKRNMEQEDNLSVSQTAVKDFYNILGISNQEKDNPNVAIQINIE